MKNKKWITIITSLVIGILIGACASYFAIAGPAQNRANQEKSKYTKLSEQAKKDSTNADKKLKDANTYYRKINNLKNNAGEQTVTKVYATAEVGKDIAPGNWSVKGKGYYYITDENNKSIGDIWVTDGGEHVQLKVGYKLKGDQGDFSTWTPEK